MLFSRRATRMLLTSFLVFSALVPVRAVDVPNRNPPAEERALREARAAIARADWAEAVSQLTPHVQAQPDSADAYNLLGYALRHLGRYAQAEVAYQRALALDPDHLGAHEYQGELMLILGRRERAQYHLRELARLCPSGCDEYDDLRRAIDAYPVSPGMR
jgi:Flp pilus assembly protein TadD